MTILGGEDPAPTPRELLSALRYPDRSVVIDLSRVVHDQKIDYIRSVLPALNVMRRRTGLPHRIVVDEAHYFSTMPRRGICWTSKRTATRSSRYCASRLPPELLAATEVMLVTCESNPAEIEALADGAQADSSTGWWRTVVGPGPSIARPGRCTADH